MVWSPLSNLLLYGQTANLGAALAAGVPVALGSDWAPSGSKNVLGELKVAQAVAGTIGVTLTALDLVRMVTTTPAAMLGWEAHLGSLEAGKRADLLVVDGQAGDPYQQLIDATEADLHLVMINGTPRVGTPGLMDVLVPGLATAGGSPGTPGNGGETLRIGGRDRTLNLAQTTADPAVAQITVGDAVDRLRAALADLPNAGQPTSPAAADAGRPRTGRRAAGRLRAGPQPHVRAPPPPPERPPHRTEPRRGSRHPLGPEPRYRPPRPPRALQRCRRSPSTRSPRPTTPATTPPSPTRRTSPPRYEEPSEPRERPATTPLGAPRNHPTRPTPAARIPSRQEQKMLIAVLNQSTLVTNDQVATMTRAIAKQVKLDTAPLWDRSPAAVIYYTAAADVPPNAHVVTVVDTIQNAPKGVLGFHTEDKGGRLWGVVAAKPELDGGAQVMTGDWSVSSVLSHEVLELFIDPNTNLWATNDQGKVYSFEVCDPVEAPTYAVDGVSVSNFVTPAWFDPLADQKATTQFDKLGLLKASFSILPGGYAVYASEGKEHQVFGDKFPDWRKDMKTGDLTRTTLRREQAGTL